MKILTIFWGESYRSGPHQSSIRGTGDYIRRQMLASISHIKLIHMLKNQGYNVDVILNTYKLNERDDKNLLEYYENNTNIINSFFYNSRFPSEMDFFKNMFNNVLHNEIFNLDSEALPLPPNTPDASKPDGSSASFNNKYDFVLFIRIDLYLKQYFFDSLKFVPDKISFAHIDSNVNINSNKFAICQQIFIIPKIYYNILPLFQQHPHFLKDEMIENGIPIDDILYMTNTLHSSSTTLTWNPFYIQVGREYSTEYNIHCSCCNSIEHYYDTKTHTFICTSIEHYYDTKTHTFIHDVSKTTEKWKDYLNIDTLEQNLAELKENSFEELLLYLFTSKMRKVDQHSQSKTPT